MLAAQTPDVTQQFGGEHVPVVGDDVSLDFVRTSPLEIAKWASAPWPVDVPYVSVEILDPCEASILAL